jgi:hypothetical protein
MNILDPLNFFFKKREIATDRIPQHLSIYVEIGMCDVISLVDSISQVGHGIDAARKVMGHLPQRFTDNFELSFYG